MTVVCLPVLGEVALFDWHSHSIKPTENSNVKTGPDLFPHPRGNLNYDGCMWWAV